VARRERRPNRRASIRERIARFVRSIFSSRPDWLRDEPWDEPAGGIGTREPRRPIRPTRSGAVALEAPRDERRDVRAVGSSD
jgi:hypothetical protein